MMIIHSQWRVKVAISLVLCFVIGGLMAQSDARDAYHKRITIKGQSISLEKILQQLSQQTKLYFIYSSNAVELKKSISLAITERPLHEVLESISEIAHIKFRREGVYVIVKALDESTPVQTNVKPILIKKHELVARATQGQDNVVNQRSMSPSLDLSLDIPNDLLKKNLLYCSPARTSIDTSGLKKYFPLGITNPRAKRYLFTSFSLMVNEYWAGAEFRAGLPSLYAVVNSGRVREGYFRHGVGIGTSLQIKPMISLNPIYTFATIRRKEDYVIDEARNLVMTDGLKIVGNHHQLKLLLQIQLSDKFRMYVGPTVNVLKTSYTYQKDIIYLSEVVVSSTPVAYGTYTQRALARSLYYSPPSDYATLKSWVGFETGVSYSIKFSRR